MNVNSAKQLTHRVSLALLSQNKLPSLPNTGHRKSPGVRGQEVTQPTPTPSLCDSEPSWEIVSATSHREEEKTGVKKPTWDISSAASWEESPNGARTRGPAAERSALRADDRERGGSSHVQRRP